jgi:CDP-diacylglycerol--glycerol-3-phosphate 3-phosphatidyltransferase
MILVPIFVLVGYIGIPGEFLGITMTYWVMNIIFIIASITDKLDGYIARSRNMVTTFGKFLDPLADKILVLSAMVMLVEFGKIPAWIPIIVLAREFLVSGYRLVAVEKGGQVVAASVWGKLKTVTQMVAIILVFIDRFNFFDFVRATTDISQTYSGNIIIFMTTPAMVFNIITSVLLTVSVIATIFSGYDYLKKGKDLFKESK